MDNRDRVDGMHYAMALSWALDEGAIAEAHRHFAQVALSMGYTVTKREPIPSIAATLGDV